MTVSSSGDPGRPLLDVTALYNPIDCQSLGVLRTTLSSLAPGEFLTVVANRFQSREIAAWAKKFRHEMTSSEEHDGRVILTLKKAGASPP